MLDYLKKFNNLPAELREKVSNQAAMAAMEKLEKKFELPLATLIMRVMVKEIALADLARALLKENLTAPAAGQLAEELKEKIFFSLGDYLSPPTLRRAELRQAGPPVQPAEPAASPISKLEPTPAPWPKRERPSELKQPAAAKKSGGQPLVKGASFFFSADDEQEIRELAKKIDLAEKTELSAEKIETKLKAIMNRVQINFGSANLADRFKQILKTYLRGVRNKLEAELTLTKSFLSGGLSFDKDSARKVMTVADKVANSKPDLPVNQAGEAIKLFSRIRLPESAASQPDKPAVVRDAPFDFSKLAKEKKNYALVRPSGTLADKAAGKKADWPRLEDTEHELAPLTPTRLARPDSARLAEAPARQAAAVKPKSAVFPLEETPPPAKPENKAFTPARATSLPAEQAGGQIPLIRRRFEAENLNQSQKVKVEDVKYVPRVMNPLDEIKYLDLINFRRLDKDPFVAALKIKSKINLLEEESYGKKLEGIKLWRSSPINRLYLAIGHLSISGNKPVDVIIEERKAKAGDYLTAAEFEAIMDLNKSLRF